MMKYKNKLLGLMVVSLVFVVGCTTKKAQESNVLKTIVSERIDIDYCKKGDSLDFSFLDSLIGEKEIVLLGEAGHGDGRTFEIKTQLIRYLIANKGFDLLALEGGGFLDMMVVNELFYVDTTLYKEPKNLRYSWNQLWSMANETKELQTLISKGEITPIGIENQGTRSSYYVPNFLKLFIQENDIQPLSSIDWDKINYVNKAILSMDDTVEVLPEDLEYTITTYNKIIDFFNDDTQVNESKRYRAELLKISVKNLVSYYEQFKLDWYTFEGQNKGINIRDKAMADNLIWHLQNKDPNSKIIVWTANFHCAKNIGSIRYKEDNQDLYASFKLFGDYIDSAYKDKVYSIAFGSAEGTTGTVFQETPEIIKADSSSLEYALLQQDVAYTFIPFDNIRNKYPTVKESVFYTDLLGYDTKPGKWLNVFDGVFFIKTNYPSSMIQD